jgi:predicted pyridoxine 5'-phosphate oxidase superfamily flavin-nucleotide-binding protein
MSILTDDMKRIVSQTRLGYVATVCPDGTPNLSAQGTMIVWDDTHLMFAEVRSPNTVENLSRNPATEINVVDPIVRRGYRFKGMATVYREGAAFFEQGVAFYRARGSGLPIRSIVLVKVERVLELVSPEYDMGATEAEVRERWKLYWEDIYGEKHETAPA